MVMIWILRAILKCLDWLSQQLPAADLTPFQGIESGAGRIFGALGNLNQYVPMVEMMSVITLLGVVYTTIQGANMIRRIISMFSGGGGS